MQGKTSHLAELCPLMASSSPCRPHRASWRSAAATQHSQPGCLRHAQPCEAHRAHRGQLAACAAAAQLARSVSGRSAISIDNKASEECTVVSVEGSSRQNLIGAVTTAFRDLGIDIRQVCLGARERRLCESKELSLCMLQVEFASNGSQQDRYYVLVRRSAAAAAGNAERSLAVAAQSGLTAHITGWQ